MAYVGNAPASRFSSIVKQTITGDGGANYTLNHPVASEQEIEVFVNNVRQEPGVAYNVAGTSLTMTGNVSSSDSFYVVFQGKAQQTSTLASNTNLSIAGLTLSGDLTLSNAVQGTTLTDTTNSGDVTLDFDTNQNFVLTLTGNVNLLNPSTEAVGQSGFIVCIQDSTGGRTLSIGTDYETAGAAGINLSSAASTTDLIPYIVVASNRILLGAPQLAFA